MHKKKKKIFKKTNTTNLSKILQYGHSQEKKYNKY